MTTSNAADDGSAAEVLAVLIDLNARAKTLLAELETLRDHLRAIKQEGSIELASFRSTVHSELSMLQRLSSKPEERSTIHAARSSNLPFLERVWGIAKRSTNLAALQKRIYYNSPSRSLGAAMHHMNLGSKTSKETGRRSAAVTVDAITDSGLIWSKVSLVTNTRILFDLAKQGWQSEGSENEADIVFGQQDDEDDIPLVKTCKELCLAARSFRVKTKVPVIHVYLPRVIVGETDEVDDVLSQCKAAGAILHCGEGVEDVPSLPESLQSMAPDPISALSSTLNIDCTILLALVSEFSHAKVSKEPWFHKALRRQVEIEGNENLLPTLLYPALSTRTLLCTTEAAKRMREIVETIGTPSEKARTAIFMGDDGTKSQVELISDLQEWSSYPVPQHLKLPIRIVDQNEGNSLDNLPPEAATVAKNMTDINRSVFLYGWGSGCSTITSNRTVVKQIEADLETFENLESSVWPKIWLCPTARSLVGKEKRGMKKEDKKEGAWPLPDPLRREHQRRNGLDVLSSREGYEVEDLRPNGYECEEVLQAKVDAAHRLVQNGQR